MLRENHRKGKYFGVGGHLYGIAVQEIPKKLSFRREVLFWEIYDSPRGFHFEDHETPPWGVIFRTSQNSY